MTDDKILLEPLFDEIMRLREDVRLLADVVGRVNIGSISGSKEEHKKMAATVKKLTGGGVDWSTQVTSPMESHSSPASTNSRRGGSKPVTRGDKK